MDDALKRKMAHEFSGIEQTTFWAEFLKAIQGHRKYHTQTLEKGDVDRNIAKAQGGIAAIDRIIGLPSELTGVRTSPQE